MHDFFKKEEARTAVHRLAKCACICNTPNLTYTCTKESKFFLSNLNLKKLICHQVSYSDVTGPEKRICMLRADTSDTVKKPTIFRIFNNKNLKKIEHTVRVLRCEGAIRLPGAEGILRGMNISPKRKHSENEILFNLRTGATLGTSAALSCGSLSATPAGTTQRCRGRRTTGCRWRRGTRWAAPSRPN